MSCCDHKRDLALKRYSVCVRERERERVCVCVRLCVYAFMRL
jgi:hypothetical protein